MTKLKLCEGEFGPGTAVDLSINNKDFKVKLGAIDNKNRPEAVYLTINSWILPKLSAKASLAAGEQDAQEVGVKAIKELEAEIRRISKTFAHMFDSTCFDQSGFIFLCDIPKMYKPGKKIFLELEVNIDTLNNIDFDGKPAAANDGRMYNLPFSKLVAPATKAANTILANGIFKSSETIEFSARK